MRKHLWNVIGIISAFGLALCLFFFGIWQLDLIVSGPVWYVSEGVGWCHPHGQYAQDYFQCFLWKTTVGRAYDTLFLLLFLSVLVPLIILFVSLWTWEDATIPCNGRGETVTTPKPCGKLRRLAKAGVWFGFALALVGSFEQALQSGNPIWSSVFGFPFLHHYLTGFIILAVSLLILETTSQEVRYV